MNLFARHRPLSTYLGSLVALFVLAFTLPLTPLAEAADHKYLVYIGTYTESGSKGIYAYRFDAGTGEINSLGLTAETEDPAFLAAEVSGRFLYAANEISQFNG